MKRLWLLLVLAMLGASSPDSAVFAPSLVNAIPDTSVNSGASVKLDFKYNIKCSSTASPTTNSPVWSATGLPAGVTLSSVGVLTGIPTASASGIVIKCVNNSSPVVGASDAFNLTVNAGGGLVAATGYFVDCDSGNNANAGTTHTAPWRTLAWAQAQTRAVGSDLWVKANTTCAEVITLGVSGTAADHSIFGTYYVASGVAYQLTPDNPTALPQNYTFSHGARAVLRGTYDDTCSRAISGLLGTPLASTTCKILKTDVPQPVPATNTRAMVRIECDYCTVQDIKITFSNGIVFANDKSRGGNWAAHHVNLIDNDISYNSGPAMQLVRIQDLYIYGNSTIAGDMGENKCADFAHNQALDPLHYNDHGAAMQLGFRQVEYTDVNFLDPWHDSRSLVEKNYYAIGCGEAIIIQKIGGIIIRGNYFNGSSAAIYTAECWHCVYEYNFMNLMGHPNFERSSSNLDYRYQVNSSLTMGKEAEPGALHYPAYVIMRGNVIINSNKCIRIGAESSVIAAGIKLSAEVYNNTCINTYAGMEIVEPTVGQNNIGTEGIHIYNNIFYNEAGAFDVIRPGTGFVSPHLPGVDVDTPCNQGSYTNVSMDYNLWSPSPTTSAGAVATNCKGAHDVYATPQFAGTDFMHKGYFFGTFPTMADIGLGAASPALGAGLALTASLNATYLANLTHRTLVTYPCATFDAQGSVIDVACVNRSNPPDIGSKERP